MQRADAKDLSMDKRSRKKAACRWSAINMVDAKHLVNKVSTPEEKKLFDITEGAD